MLWLPLKHVNKYAVKARASTYLRTGELLEAHYETDRHIVVPRNYPIEPPFPIYDLSPTQWEEVDWGCYAESLNHEQAVSWGRLSEQHSGTLNLACGKGKTVLAIRKLALERGPALIVVHTTQLMGQWIERLVEFLELDGVTLLPENIGIVRGKKAEWDKPIVLAMIQTLVKRQVPIAIRKRFKTVIYDECHHLAAPSWLGAARFGFGNRIGLSATPTNELGTHELYYQHIGPIFHSDLVQELIPTCWFMSIPGGHDLNDPNIRDCSGDLSMGMLYRVLGQKPQRNGYICAELDKALSKGRKILVLSQSVDQCTLLHSMYEDSGLCIGDVHYEQRLEYLRTKQICFGTMPVAVEGLDQKDLDMVAILTPFKSPTWLQQILGRIQRPGGKPPIAIFFVDREIFPCARLTQKLMERLHQWEFPMHTKVIR
jgi:superfamily II DNA or RNA helicase